ncbi:pesticin C-terminus-like muramidase [Serratia sp. NPDC078593]|uniref:pesticin C-terminus-like muramidase n=1 Tax=unclassified Serratia (in: enterobacteria) TaxID=2647522 RepID=UPI0037D7F8FD
MIVKHPSEWYHKKDTSIWQSFLNKLTNDAPEWKTYSEAYIEKMVWMQDATKLKLGPMLWHMHPVMFLGAIGDKFGDTIDFQTSLGVYRISKKAANLILKAEGYQKTPYVPQGSDASGVTIGYGYDLGQQTASKMRAMLSGYFSEGQLDRLQQAIGLQGDRASAVIPSLSDITISREDAVALAMKMKEKYAQIVVDTYPEVLNTHPHCQGAMLSLVINRGTSFTRPSVASRVEMKKIHDDFISGNLSNIPSQFRSMKRLWIGKGLDGLITRREDEAKLFEEGMAQ